MRERGRENGSFPVVEVLKPQGFKEECNDDAHVEAEKSTSTVAENKESTSEIFSPLRCSRNAGASERGDLARFLSLAGRAAGCLLHVRLFLPSPVEFK